MSAVEDDADVVWPIPEEGVTRHEAYSTLWSLKDAELSLSPYEEDGNTVAADLYVDLYSLDDQVTFFRRPLIEMLKDELKHKDAPQLDVSDFDDMEEHKDWLRSFSGHARATRLVLHLIEAYEHWKQTDAKMSPGELLTKPFRPRPRDLE